MSITITAAASDRVKEYLRSRGKGEGLRFGVKANGCSGYKYVVNYADEIGPVAIHGGDEDVLETAVL